MFLILLLAVSTACGKITNPDGTESPSNSPNTESATPVATPSPTPAATAIPTPEPTPAPESGESQAIIQSFEANDFTVPGGSAVSRENWLVFLRQAMMKELSSYSGTQGFLQAFGFTSEAGAGSGETQLACKISIAWFFPGNRVEQYVQNRENLGVNLIVMEQEGKLSLLTFQSDYTDAATPAVAENALRKSYETWVKDWEAKSGKDPAAIPAVKTPVGYEPIGKLSKNFQPPAQGETTSDLDGDGTPETIRVAFTTEDAKWKISVKEAVISGWYDAPEGSYIVDINETDKQREVAITDHGPSSDDLTQLFTYRNGEMVKVGSVSGILFACDGKGRVSTYSRSWQGPLLTWFFNIEYQMDDSGRLGMMPTRWYASKLPLKIKQTLQLYKGPDSKDPGITLQAGTKVTMDLSDVTSWFHLKTADGREGWIRFQDAESLVFPDGSLHNQTDVLDGIASAD